MVPLKDVHALQLALFDAGMLAWLAPLRAWESMRSAQAAWMRGISRPPEASPAPRCKRSHSELYSVAAMRVDHIPAGDPPGFGKL